MPKRAKPEPVGVDTQQDSIQAAKWAVGGFTGGMRTNWGTRANEGTPDLLPDYEPSVGTVAKQLAPLWGHQNSDPVKVAQVVLRLRPAIVFLHISSSAATPFRSPARPKRRVRPTPNAVHDMDDTAEAQPSVNVVMQTYNCVFRRGILQNRRGSQFLPVS
jgi:hypothetical protein